LEVLEHFYIKVIIPIEVFGIDISITNLTVSLIGAAILFLVFFILLALRPKVIPSKGQVVIEMLVNFIERNIVYNMIGKKEGDRWFPLIGGIFIFVLSCSLIGIIPGLYTPTANPIVNITLAVVVFLTVQISCIAKTGIHVLQKLGSEVSSGLLHLKQFHHGCMLLWSQLR
jgi:F-type H+-transporting ATPase subunit a